MARLQCPKTGRFFQAELSDDGTLDTIIRCSECGAEMRYNYAADLSDGGMLDPDSTDPTLGDPEARYTEWVNECRDDFKDAHSNA